ncbi:cellulose synthase (UDP-forming) [Microlunatus sagamiharensis]|uniref:Cellulose synthase (UDP-forming) n=1 Tax=Microlunatus sagamiharensis TaxID=546874 RepID=A0A1H2N9Y3_9ACTN|nr:glycosyltransferase [Microlunatus sagamiharensis]SDV02154.1 cellulose synthase (UDP-forming) [Microlunatus sagamiharensis]
MRPHDLADPEAGPAVRAAVAPGSSPRTGVAPPVLSRVDMRRATVASGNRLAGWAYGLSPMVTESRRSRLGARLGILTAITALVVYVTWRILFTLPLGGWDLVAAWVLVAFEILPVAGLVIRAVTLWDIDTRAPVPVSDARPGQRCVVMIPTYNEPVEVIAPTIAAALELEPAHQTWVLDDGSRPWVAELCAALGARHVTRLEHTHAKAGNMNHALDLLAAEVAEGAEPVDVVAVLDCDHVPLPTFLTATLGHFDDPDVALVQAPQTYYNSGAFDDDGSSGEQGVFFHVLLPGRNHDGAGPFWCGSTSLIRLSALREVGGISTDTIVEDMHTTLLLIRKGWKTVYHHQVLALGLAPDTPEQYLLQRRRWGMGCMQVLVTERLWAARRWLSWRNFYEYLSGPTWWLEGVGTVLAFLVPAVVLVSGARVSTADPLVFTIVFAVMFAVRLWGVRLLFRGHQHWPTAFALRVLRIPVGLACLWWLVTRRELTFQVTPKSGADQRLRGRVPAVVWGLLWTLVAVAVYALLGLSGYVPWHSDPSSTAASGLWLALAGTVLVMSIRRIQAAEYATSRRNAHRVALRAPVTLDGTEGELVDLSLGGAAVRFPRGTLRGGTHVDLALPGTEPVRMETVRVADEPGGSSEVVSLRVPTSDWAAYRTVALWLFHTPAGVVDGLPDGVPAVATRRAERHPHAPVLARQFD